VPPITFCHFRLLSDRHRLTRHHGFVDDGATLDDDAVDRHLLTRAHAQAIADLDRVDVDVLVALVGDAARGLGREAEQRPDRTRGLRAGAQLQHLAEQHQHRNHGRRLEIHRDRAMHVAERRREQLRCQRRDHAVEIGDAGADRDQREHVEIARDQRLPATHEERRAGPQHHRRRQHERDPVRGGLRHQVHQPEMAAHLEHEHRQGEHQRDPEPSGHVDQFGIGTVVERDLLGLQRHAADRARAGTDLAHLGVHRAGVDRAGRRRRLRLARLEEFLRLGLEAFAAARRAEIVGAAAVFGLVLCRVRVHVHSTDRVFRQLNGTSTACRRMSAVPAGAMAVHRVR
jgi:hypothetical protein